MNATPHNIVVSSCEYTPVYLIQNPGVIQASSYIVAQPPIQQEDLKPSESLKRFYENSGNIENGLLVNNIVNIDNVPKKPKILRRVDSSQIGNNLKLASFLLPKQNALFDQASIKSIVIPPNKAAIPPTPPSLAPLVPPPKPPPHNVQPKFGPKMEFDSKIRKVDICPKPPNRGRIPIKVQPKSAPDPIKQSLQLLKLGETYHSLNELSDEQMKIVNQALKNLREPEKIPTEPTFDPVTNTKIIYKIVSPKDLTVVGKNRIVFKERKEMKKPKEEIEVEPPPKEPEVIKVTRSGRQVKPPKIEMTEDFAKHKRKSTPFACYQCHVEFTSIFRLQKHYEQFPTHIPAKIHSNLFQCLLAIIQSGSDEDKLSIFIQQLEQLIKKLKSMLPCLLKKVDGDEAKMYKINEDIGRLFGMNPGQYNLNLDALDCVRDNNCHCRHNPPKNSFSSDLGKPSQLWLSKHNEEIANSELENDCARINSFHKHPGSNKIWKLKQKKKMKVTKKVRLTSENDSFIDLGHDDMIFDNSTQSAAPAQSLPILDGDDAAAAVRPAADDIDHISLDDQRDKKPKKKHAEFHSAHFDIRSSPIKPSSAIFRRFQINTDKQEIQIISPLSLDKKTDNVLQDIPNTETTLDLQQIFRDEVDLQCKETNDINRNINFESSKEWTLSETSDPTKEWSLPEVNGGNIKDWPIGSQHKTWPITSVGNTDVGKHWHMSDGSQHKTWDIAVTNEQSQDTYMKPNNIIEPSLIHVKDDGLAPDEGEAQLADAGRPAGLSGLSPAGEPGLPGLGPGGEAGLPGLGPTGEAGLPGLGGGEADLPTLDAGPGEAELAGPGQSVLSLLYSLGGDCLTYPETEIRNNSVDFQLDLFSFNNT